MRYSEPHLSTGEDPSTGYRVDIVTADGGRVLPQLVHSLLNGNYAVSETFKDTSQTYIARIRIEEQDLVLKIPRDRNKRTWQRFLSLFRSSESFRHLHSMITLRKLGFHCPEPIMALQTVRAGHIIDSALVYRFEEGHKPQHEDIPRVINTLLSLHRLGYLRRDPHAKNFLVQADRVTFIDFRLSKPILFRQLRLNRELCAFLRTTPEGLHHLEPEFQRTLWFRLALKLDRLLSAFKKIRRGTRRRMKGS